jgi:hypothetical protein
VSFQLPFAIWPLFAVISGANVWLFASVLSG